jgi:heterodisulfide reductase subunit C
MSRCLDIDPKRARLVLKKDIYGGLSTYDTPLLIPRGFVVSQTQGRIVQLDELNTEFSDSVTEAGGEKISVCLQCGTCTASCPINRFNETYNPRVILRAIFLGLKEKVFSNNIIWLCASCYSCTERCPRGVRPTEIIRVIRNLAVAEGQVHPFYKLQAEAISQFGRIFQADEFTDELRESVGLPSLPQVAVKEVSTILQRTDMKKILSSERSE